MILAQIFAFFNTFFNISAYLFVNTVKHLTRAINERKIIMLFIIKELIILQKKSLAVIGGGASGMAAAVEAAREAKKINEDIEISVYEKLPKIGKKILATGNGRCNILNSGSFEGKINCDKNLLNNIFSQFSVLDNIKFFESLGILMAEETDGRLYPMSLQASSVLDALRFETENLGINIICDAPVTDIKISTDGFILNDTYHADSVIVAGGGKASPVQGSDGSCLTLLKSLGIKINTVFPALTGIVLKKKNKALKGVRAHGEIFIVDNGKVTASDCGELQYTDYGISGIPAMNVSRFVAEHFAYGKKGKIYACINTLPDFSPDEIFSYILNRKKQIPKLLCEDLLSGIIPKKLAVTKLQSASIPLNKEIGNLTKNEISALTEVLNSEIFEITGTLGFENSQVSAGGASTESFNTNTLEARKIKGLFACGEILDVDAQCGGYNLSWAWSSGRCAGKNAIIYLTEKYNAQN